MAGISLYIADKLFEMWKKPANGYLILSISDIVDAIVAECGGLEGYDLMVEQLRQDKNSLPLVFGDGRLAGFVPYIIPHSGADCEVRGLSGEIYRFSAFNILDKIRDDASGIYIFAITKKDDRTPQNRESHIFLSFSSVQQNNQESIVKAKAMGAHHMLYYYCPAEYRRKEIIDDIKGSQDYKYQLAHFTEFMKKI